jgi:hypothetical protein
VTLVKRQSLHPCDVSQKNVFTCNPGAIALVRSGGGRSEGAHVRVSECTHQRAFGAGGARKVSQCMCVCVYLDFDVFWIRKAGKGVCVCMFMCMYVHLF